eukprot:NODE_244_length_2041_cov_108.796687_g210_i0.p8 GENE.NODE_244_length_2041_cov_108.796687_g210_i0~~NODE_244_length_2041_cov_108.796687_g210_i0.p8  ORF type:complete len:66 (+),score=35.66 NODE_244_length_2041_cov_108.796687_g210_i0:1828-2025(+)
MTTEEPEQIKQAVEKLRNSSMEIGKAIYSQQNESSEQSQEQNQEQSSEQTQEQSQEQQQEGEKKQ